MSAIIQFLAKNRIYFFLFGLTLLIGVPPFLRYSFARLSGSLPSFEEWARYGGNHGPWHFLPSADVIVNTSFALLILSGTTLVASIVIAIRSNTGRFVNFAKGFALAILQVLWAFMILWTMFWAID